MTIKKSSKDGNWKQEIHMTFLKEAEILIVHLSMKTISNQEL